MAKHVGRCHICGLLSTLTREHVPLQSAFNGGSYISVPGIDAINIGPDEPIVGKSQQGGVSYFTLCGNCNSLTGRRYGNDYKAWAATGMHHLLSSGGNPQLFCIHHICPGRVFKEIVAMFLSINTVGFGDRFPGLRKYVLDPDSRGIPPEIRIYGYYTDSTRLRYIGVNAIGAFPCTPRFVSEVSCAPYGYVMTVKSSRPDSRLVDLTWLSKYGSSEFTDVAVALKKLPIVSPFPCDFRSREQILVDFEANSLREANAFPPDPGFIHDFRNMAKSATDTLIHLGVEKSNIVAVAGQLPECLFDQEADGARAF